MWVIRSVNRLNVDNLGPPGIRGDSVDISVDFDMNTMSRYRKKNLTIFFLVDMRLLFLSQKGGCYRGCQEYMCADEASNPYLLSHVCGVAAKNIHS
jgi:hypothetical protein